MSLLETVKKVALDAVEASTPSKIVLGVIVSTNPISINVDQRFILTEDFLIITRTFAQSGINNGDKVVMIRQHGGQQYLIIDKVV